MTLRIGVIGANYAVGTHLPVYAALPDVELVAVATAHEDTARAVAERFGARPHVGFEALCADPDVDLVDVATRPSRHREMAEAALAAGKDVLVEAPLAPSLGDAEAMAKAAAGRNAWVDMQSRFWPGMQEFRALVESGWLGTVENVVATAFYPTFTRPEAVAGSGWCADAANGASSLRVHGLHTADLIRWLFGDLEVTGATVATRRPEWPGGVPATSADSVAFTARLPSGAVCSVHTSWVARHGDGWRLVAHGSDGTLVATAAGHTGHFPVRLQGARADEPQLRDLVVPGEEPATFAFAELVRRIAAGGEGVPTFEDGIATLRVAEAVEEGR
ncbi:Predicted dehydrogenase [Pseudonocardia thermophila]|uniref:Predicted dehydrogenase n=1 Tax=Pseudonocardia thermophila TaxID=1848 RepID=A0A1M6T7Z9_PSETH|nr:Gfo/Idh/MocA family oxidoreductase [Pseudonocardia thermophila]SHK53121.1 Predicted dehydrogenase [Pseudonocardia thermophila]